MRWRRILLFASTLALGVGAILAVPIARDAWLVHRERKAAEPHPLPANAHEQAAILFALARAGELRVLEDPPSLGGKSLPKPPLPALLETTVPLCSDGDVPAGAGCGPIHGERVSLEPIELEGMPLKLRQELVLANRVARRLAVDEVPGIATVSQSDVRAAYADGAFFRGTADGVAEQSIAAGYVEVSTAVLTPDRREALIVVASGCGPDCRIIGNLYRLTRQGESWRVTDEQMIWAHVY